MINFVVERLISISLKTATKILNITEHKNILNLYMKKLPWKTNLKCNKGIQAAEEFKLDH